MLWGLNESLPRLELDTLGIYAVGGTVPLPAHPGELIRPGALDQGSGFDGWAWASPAIWQSAAMVATLDHATRRAIAWLYCAAQWFGWEDCGIYADRVQVCAPSPSRNQAVLMLAFATVTRHALTTRGTSLSATLHALSLSDPNPRYRQRSTLRLLLDYPDAAESRLIAPGALNSKHALERVAAAVCLGEIDRDAGHQALIRLSDEEAGTNARLIKAAVSLLLAPRDREDGSTPWPISAPDVASKLLDAAPNLVAKSTIEAVWEMQAEWGPAWLQACLPIHPFVLGACYQLICTHPAPCYAPVAVDLLASRTLSVQENIRLIEYLGQVGSKESIPELRTHTDDFFDPRGPKAVAEAAIADIQARIKGAAVGQLSMVVDDELRGGLSDGEE